MDIMTTAGTAEALSTHVVPPSSVRPEAEWARGPGAKPQGNVDVGADGACVTGPLEHQDRDG